MSGRVTSTPAAKHHCSAGWRIETDEEFARRKSEAAKRDPDDWFPPGPPGRLVIMDPSHPRAGTIWTCDDCGREWKATYPYANVFSPTWVRHYPIKPIRWPWRRK